MVEALKQSFMDFQLSCTSPLPQIWAIETLAHSNQLDISLLLDLLDKTPQVSDDIGRNARELVSLRILESFSVPGAPENPVSPASSQKIRLDPCDDSCEDVLKRILTETSPSHLKPPGTEMSKWDLQPFIEHKRSSLARYALQQLKDAMLTGSHSFLASLKGRSGLAVGNQPEHGPAVDDSNCNGTKPGVEGSPANMKRRAPTENAGESSCENLILLQNGCETHIKSVKKFKHDIICSEQNVGEKLISSVVDVQIADTPTESMQHSEGERKTHVAVALMELNEPPNDNKCTSSEGLVGLDEISPLEKQVPCDSELNNKSEVKRQGHDIEEAKGDKEGLCDLSRTNDVDHIQRNILNVGEEEGVDISSDTDGKSDDRTDIATKGNATLNHQYAQNQDFVAVDASRRYSEEELCSLGKKTDIEVKGHNGPPEDGNTAKGPVGLEKVLPPEKQALHLTPQCQNDKFDHGDENAGHKNGHHRHITTNENMDKLQQSVLGNVPNVVAAEEDVDISSDSDGYHDEMTNIDTQKKTFLSSQCTYSQDSLGTTDWIDSNLCVKCSLGGKLLVCSSESCPLVVHQSCLGSDAIFGTRGKFYCPFCAYSRAISKYMEIKKKASLARKNLATFISLGTQKESKKQSHRLCKMNQNHLEHDDSLPKSNELNKRDVKKVRDRHRRKKLEYEQAGPSEYSPPFGKKVASTLNKDKQEVKRTRQVSQSVKACEQHQMIHKSQDENTSGQALERSDSGKEPVNIKSKKETLYPPDTDLPRENECSRSSHSADVEETSEEENKNSGASKYSIRARKQERQISYPAIPQLRRKRLPWTSEEEEKLKEGMRSQCSPHDKLIPWKKILEHGVGVFHKSRSTIDLKDKWRNMCKATPKSK